MKKHYILIALISSALTACGGGGGGGDKSTNGQTPAPGETLTGSFIDSPVEGLWYETPTQSGLTNHLGEFTYQAGESVTFRIGGTKLGVAQGASIITPFSLLQIAPMTTETEISSALTANTINSFDRAINIAALLQTLDIDANPDDNGINLGTSHQDLKNLNIPLMIKASAFEQQPAVIKAKELTGASQPRTLKKSIQHIYDSLGIEVKSSLTSSFTAFQNNTQLESVSFDYNNEGKLISKKVDSNNDGEIDTSKTFKYDTNGNLIRIETLLTNPESETIETLTYDDNNNLLSRTIDSAEGNNTAETYTYTDNQLALFELDKNGDGSTDTSTKYSYNSQNNLTKKEVDRNGDGSINSTASYTYLGSRLHSFSEDKNNDGSPNFIISYTYDENGNRTSQKVDLSSDGALKPLSTFEYDNNNNLTRYEQDRDQDGQVDYIESYAHDQNNNRTRYKRDLDADGVWDVVAQYTYDINGNRTKMLQDSDGNGTADKVWAGNFQAATLDNTWDIILKDL